MNGKYVKDIADDIYALLRAMNEQIYFVHKVRITAAQKVIRMELKINMDSGMLPIRNQIRNQVRENVL